MSTLRYPIQAITCGEEKQVALYYEMLSGYPLCQLSPTTKYFIQDNIFNLENSDILFHISDGTIKCRTPLYNVSVLTAIAHRCKK